MKKPNQDGWTSHRYYNNFYTKIASAAMLNEFIAINRMQDGRFNEVGLNI